MKGISQLSLLLSQIIKLKGRARRIALTATPMELDAQQWENIFDRIGESVPKTELEKFEKALKAANRNPANRGYIEDLVDASQKFSTAMKPYVTRRRRTNQKEMKDLVGWKPCQIQAHPHRNLEPITIAYDEIDTSWRSAVFALEAAAKTAKGLAGEGKKGKFAALLRRIKTLDSRYAAGQIIGMSKKRNVSSKNEKNDDDSSSSFSAIISMIEDFLKSSEGDIQPVAIQKLKRVRYWLQVQQNMGNSLESHPRVQKMADEIEKSVWKSGRPDEKVLVFGTFTAPLKALRDVLNRRAFLRLLDRRTASGDTPPVPGVERMKGDIDELWRENERISPNSATDVQGKGNRHNLQLSRSYADKDELLEELNRASKSYQKIRDQLKNHINSEYTECLPGDYAIKKGNLKDDVARYLRSRIIADIISGSDVPVPNNVNAIKLYALKIWEKFLEHCLDTEDDDHDKVRTKWEPPDFLISENSEDNGTLASDCYRLDTLADNMGPAALSQLIKNEIEDLSYRFGGFTRLLNGDVKMETRRILQGQFNAQHTFPWILIAQSQVGREGLNLHKTCKTVMQFHPEWNPGVLEQQIGRVDRIKSKWESCAESWNKENPDQINPWIAQYNGPKINIKPIVFEGTYDAFQYEVSKRRNDTLMAHLFGELLPYETLSRMPEGEEWEKLKNDLKDSAPDFTPPNPAKFGNGSIEGDPRETV
jgi:hypothetical protein